MPQINNGKSPPWVAGEIVTAAGLNGMIDSATLDPSAVTSQSNLTTLTGDEYALIVDTAGLLKKTQLKNSLLTGQDIKTDSITQVTGSSTLLIIQSNPSAGLLVDGINALTLRSQNGNIGIDTTSAGGGGNVYIQSNGIIFDCAGGSNTGTAVFDCPVVFNGTTNIIPTGAVMLFANSAVPAGWVKCNGVAVSRTSSTYAPLFAKIGTTYGVGDGVNTFNLPDLRGEFVRGWDDGRGVDTGRALGSSQLQQLEAHKHIASNNDCQNYAAVNGTGTGNYNAWCDTNGIGSGGGAALTGDGTHIEQTAKIGTETRPRNVAMMYCIKL